MPLRVVMVGFSPGEVDTAKLLSRIPNSQRPGVPDRAETAAARTARAARKRHADQPGARVLQRFHALPGAVRVPVEAAGDLRPERLHERPLRRHGGQLHHGQLRGRRPSPSSSSNAERGVYRGTGNQVAPDAPVRFVDGERTELDCRELQAPPRLRLRRARQGPGANPGYTVFVLNTWDSAEARGIIKPQHEYHVFRAARIDPDTGQFDGVDWARVWGGRYRFMMVDLGAAPNAYESETWGNRNRSGVGLGALRPPALGVPRRGAPPVTAVNIPAHIEQAVTPGASSTRSTCRRCWRARSTRRRRSGSCTRTCTSRGRVPGSSGSRRTSGTTPRRRSRGRPT